jgi:hypothetical protein
MGPLSFGQSDVVYKAKQFCGRIPGGGCDRVAIADENLKEV